MAEHISVSKGSKEQIYTVLLPQIKAVLESESDLIANLGNVTAILKQAFNHLWTGFYLVKSEHELVLGPFQGSLACTRIQKGRGVCGVAWETITPQVVPDVNKFPNHICCDMRSRSEIVIPLVRGGKVWGVLDIDSDETDTFDDIDRYYLEILCNEILSTKEYK